MNVGEFGELHMSDALIIARRDEKIAELEAEVTRLRDLVDRAVPCVVAALNCPAHPWHGSDVARKWLVESYA